MMEQMGLADQDRPLQPHGRYAPGHWHQPLPPSMNQFERLEQFAKLQKAPAVKFKDLEAAVSPRSVTTAADEGPRGLYPRDDHSIFSNITLQFDRKDLQFQDKDGISKAVVNIYARITSMAAPDSERVRGCRDVEVPAGHAPAGGEGSAIYQKTVPLPPGKYRLNVVAKDIVGRQHEQLTKWR